MASLAEIRARLQAAESKQGGESKGGDRAIYPHWNMDEGHSALVRFLPDGNSKNTFFWIERAMIKLPFVGIKGESDIKPTQVQIPCVEMWGESCPILNEVRTWFKDKSLEEQGRRYWKKRSYIFQGFVRENPISDDETPDNPIRRFIIGPQIFQIIKSALMDPEMEELPTDYAAGLDFRIAKTIKGGYADYSTSKWSRKESSLTEVEATAIAQHGLFDLAGSLPKKPGDVEMRVMQEMFEASVNGESYDPDRWSQYFRPAGVAAPTGGSTHNDGNTSAVKAVAAAPTASVPFDTDDDELAAAIAPVSATKAPSQKAEDILAMIRSRQNKS